jgi:hypothetical protein
MAAVTKVIQLPAPIYTTPAVEQWGVAQLQFNPITETASVLLVAVNPDGTQIAGGASRSFGVSGATYRQLFSAQLAASLVSMINTAGQAAGIFAPGSTVVDAAE